MEIKWTPTEKMWCDIITKPKQSQFFRKFRGYLMNLPANYDDQVERLLTHPDLLPRVEADPTLSENDKSIFLKPQRKQKRESVSFAKYVSLEKKSTTKYIRSTNRLLSQRVQKQNSTSLKHRRSVLEYYEYRQSACSLKEISRANSVVRHRTRGNTKSAQGMARYQPRSDDVARQWDIYHRYLRISYLPKQ